MADRVVFFPAGGMSDGCARTRLYYYLPELRERGIRFHVASYTYHRYDVLTAAERRSPLPRLWLELLPLRTFFAVLMAGTVWMQKVSVKPWAVRLARLLRKRIVYDLDDALFLKPPRGEGRGAHAIERHDEWGRIIEGIMRQADAVVVSGDVLADFARQFTSHVTILPTTVGQVASAPSIPPDPPVIVWVGAPENLRYLLTLEKVLIRLQRETPDLKVRLITSRLLDQPHFRYDFIPWSVQAEADNVPTSTVGVAPLADDEWCRAKMNYKALVYMSHGVPAVISPVGFPVGDFVDGESVKYARNENEWHSAIREMVSNRNSRDQMARNGLKILNEKYTAHGHAEELAALLTGA